LKKVEYPSIWDAVKVCLNEVNKRRQETDEHLRNQPEFSEYWLAQLRSFSSERGHFFGSDLPKLKAAVPCVGSLGPEVALIFEAEPGVHQPYIKLLEETIGFIENGKARNGWVIWSG
jgi:hypothetical protein